MGVKCQVLCSRCHVPGVMCQLSGVRCQVSRFTFHMSLTPTATHMDPAHTNSIDPSTVSGNDQKIYFFAQQFLTFSDQKLQNMNPMTSAGVDKTFPLKEFLFPQPPLPPSS